MTKQTRPEAAETLRRIVGLVERGELDAPDWYVERLRSAAICAARAGSAPLEPTEITPAC